MSQLNRKLLWLTSIRMVIVGSIVLTFILYPDLASSQKSLLVDFIAATSLQSLLYLALLRILRRRPEVHAYVQLLGDLLLITWLLYRLADASQFTILYIIVITVASVFLRRTGVLIVAGLAYVLYTSIAFHWLEALLVAEKSLPSLPEDPPEVFRLLYNLIMHLVGFYGVAILTSYLARDVERAEAELREKHQDLSFLQALHGDVIQSITSGLAVTDLAGVVVDLNPSGEEILGRAQREVVGRHVTASGLFTAEEWQELTEKPMDSRLRAETRCRRGDGDFVYLGFTLAELRDSEGARRGYIVIFQDLTEWRKLQEKVRIHDRMAALGQMAAGLAHEVGNPLAAISGSVEMLARSASADGDERRLLEITLKESRRLDRTVKNFLQFARPPDRRARPIDIAALICEDVQLLRNSEDVRPDHVIEADLEPPAAVVHADLDQIGQIFWNLAGNALQAMPAGGKLTITGRLYDEVYRLEFRDTGQGMSEEERAKLFQPFKSFFDRGIGLGMAIVYRLVTEHGGDIRVESEPGQGTLITVDLPLRPPDAALAEQEAGWHATAADY